MNILPKFPPSSVRSGSSLPPATGTRSPEPRLYFVGTGMRRPTITPEKRILPLFPHESEDARLTGETRSLFRRLLALNLPFSTDSIAVATIKASIKKSPDEKSSIEKIA